MRGMRRRTFGMREREKNTKLFLAVELSSDACLFDRPFHQCLRPTAASPSFPAHDM